MPVSLSDAINKYPAPSAFWELSKTPPFKPIMETMAQNKEPRCYEENLPF